MAVSLCGYYRLSVRPVISQSRAPHACRFHFSYLNQVTRSFGGFLISTVGHNVNLQAPSTEKNTNASDMRTVTGLVELGHLDKKIDYFITLAASKSNIAVWRPSVCLSVR